MTRLILAALLFAAAIPPVLLWKANGAARIDVPVRVVTTVEIKP